MAEGDTRILTSKAYRALSTVLDYLDDDLDNWRDNGEPANHIGLCCASYGCGSRAKTTHLTVRAPA